MNRPKTIALSVQPTDEKVLKPGDVAIVRYLHSPRKEDIGTKLTFGVAGGYSDGNRGPDIDLEDKIPRLNPESPLVKGINDDQATEGKQAEYFNNEGQKVIVLVEKIKRGSRESGSSS